MHTILGAGGPVANALTKELINHNETIRLVSRKPVDTNNNQKVTWQKADLLNYDEVLAAAKGSIVIYLVAGLVYDKDIWRAQWPVIMQNVINVTKATGARLIFFDNVYMYGLVNGAMTEDTPYKPSSVKGEIRAGIANMLMDEVKAGNINATIARAPDFYGAPINSFIDMMVLSNYAKKQNAQWIGNPNCKHNFIYVPDAGKAMFMLGQDPDSGNQIWHLPTPPAITGKQFLDIAARVYKVEPKYTSVNKVMLWMFGLFKKVVMGTVEMYYQYDHDYIFDSSKFEKAFNFKPTSYEDGITKISKTPYKS